MLLIAKAPEFCSLCETDFPTVFFALRGGTCLIGARLKVDRRLQFDR